MPLSAAENPREIAPNVLATVDLGWSMSGNSAAPEASVAPTTQVFGDSCPMEWLSASAVTAAQAARPLIACVGPVANLVLPHR